MTNRFVTLWV